MEQIGVPWGMNYPHLTTFRRNIVNETQAKCVEYNAPQFHTEDIYEGGSVKDRNHWVFNGKHRRFTNAESTFGRDDLGDFALGESSGDLQSCSFATERLIDDEDFCVTRAYESLEEEDSVIGEETSNVCLTGGEICQRFGVEFPNFSKEKLDKCSAGLKPNGNGTGNFHKPGPTDVGHSSWEGKAQTIRDEPLNLTVQKESYDPYDFGNREYSSESDSDCYVIRSSCPHVEVLGGHHRGQEDAGFVQNHGGFVGPEPETQEAQGADSDMDVFDDGKDFGFSQESEPGQGFNQESEPGQGFNQESDQGQGFNQDSEQGQGFNQESDSGQGFYQESERGQGFNQESEPGQGFNQESEPGQGFNQDSEQGQGFNQESEQGRGFNQESEPGQGFNQNSEQGQGFSQESEPGQGFNQESEQGQGFNQESELGQGFNQESELGQGFNQESELGQFEEERSRHLEAVAQKYEELLHKHEEREWNKSESRRAFNPRLRFTKQEKQVMLADFSLARKDNPTVTAFSYARGLRIPPTTFSTWVKEHGMSQRPNYYRKQLVKHEETVQGETASTTKAPNPMVVDDPPDAHHRRAYTLREKLQMIRECEAALEADNTMTFSEFAQQKEVPCSTLKSWIRNKELIKENASNSKKNGTEQKIFTADQGYFPEMEANLFDWYQEQVAQGVEVSNYDLKRAALEHYMDWWKQSSPEEQAEYVAKRPFQNAFKASNGWVRSFYKRFNIPNRLTRFDPTDTVEHSAMAFRLSTQYIIQNLKPQVIANVDEIFTMFHQPNPAADDEPIRCTVTLGITSDGRKMPVHVTFKKPPPEALHEIHHLERKDFVISQSPTGWIRKEPLRDYLNNVLLPFIQNTKYLLLWDTFRCHSRKEVLDMVKNTGGLVNFIPVKCTTLSQPLDLGVKDCYRRCLEQRWLDWKVVHLTQEGFPQVTQGDVVRVAAMAWGDVPECVLLQGFRAAGLIPGQGSEDSDTDTDDDGMIDSCRLEFLDMLEDGQ